MSAEKLIFPGGVDDEKTLAEARQYHACTEVYEELFDMFNNALLKISEHNRQRIIAELYFEHKVWEWKYYEAIREQYED